MISPNRNRKRLLEKYRPKRLDQICGQPEVVACLEAFVAEPSSACFLFHGPTGVGKTAAAWALAYELGCPEEEPELGGVCAIPSGKQDGKAVEELLRAMRLRPLLGSGWRVAIINEVDRMTDQAEMIWLDGLEHLPPKCIVIFTTNEPEKLSDRLASRCEAIGFSGTSPELKRGMDELVRHVWKQETGRRLRRLPADLGRFDLASGTISIRLALQQIAPYLRTGQALPEEFGVPIIRELGNGVSNGSTAAKKAWATRRRRLGQT